MLIRPFDVVCLSHLRWEFVYQRPQHLMTRFARTRRVFFVEEPTYGEGPWDPLSPAEARLDVRAQEPGVTVAVARLAETLSEREAVEVQRSLLDELLADAEIEEYVLWYYTPMALPFTRHLEPLASVYDCMDELSGFSGAPPELGEREAELFERADLVFTGGPSLYEAKRERHRSVHLFPSSVDLAHFAQARSPLPEPPDQIAIPHPRLGFFGVIDERMDLELLGELACARPDWQLVVVGPSVGKFDLDELPRAANVHYLGGKHYDELPAYIAGWDVALLPFARNDSTRFISPTKIPEYLAAGRPVVSTSISDVVRPYGERGFVHIADSPPDFVAAVERALRDDEGRLPDIDASLSEMSWDRTWERMERVLARVVTAKATPPELTFQEA